MFRAIFNGFSSIHIKSCAFVLKNKIIERFMIFLFAKDNFIAIYIDKVRLLIIFKIETIAFILKPNFMTRFHAALIYINSQRDTENFSSMLNLPDSDFGYFF